jgi:ribosomal protein S18 acetylase RimI-like enzyme
VQPLERDADRRWVDVAELALELAARPAQWVIVAQQLQHDQALRAVLLQWIDLLLGHVAIFGLPPSDPSDSRLSWREKTQIGYIPGLHSPPATPGLRRATIDDVQRLRTVLAEAFMEDPIFGWLIPNDARRQARLRHYFETELRHFALPRGRVETTDDLAGAMLSLPPGRWRVPLRTTLLHGRVFGVRIAKAASLGAAMEWRHTRLAGEPHYYVRDIGVHPDKQGRGLGGALMRPTLDRCDQEGLPAYIEASNERSAVLYARLGFQLIEELRVWGSPPLRLMLRPPRTPEARP